MVRKARLAPYHHTSLGFEAIYADESSVSQWADGATKNSHGNLVFEWSTWPFTWLGQDKKWGQEIRFLNDMQNKLGNLNSQTRQIRAHIASLIPCNSGFPVTADELLQAIGKGKLETPSFYNGCWNCGMWWETKITQPRHAESMRTIYDVLKGYLSEEPEDTFRNKYPHAQGFVQRTYEWLGPRGELAELKRLMLERLLLPFKFFAKCPHASQEDRPDKRLELNDVVHNDCFGQDGRGAKLDAEMSQLAGIPTPARLNYKEYEKTFENITSREKKRLYKLCSLIAFGVYELSDCHHNAFRVIESQIYGIGTLGLGMPLNVPYGLSVRDRNTGSERRRLGRLLFGYVLGLDKWLMRVPMQFLLLDLGHVNLGFDPRNEILRVYGYLREEVSAVKEWLVGCLWHNLAYNPNGGLVGHSELLTMAERNGLSCREWIDSRLGNKRR